MFEYNRFFTADNIAPRNAGGEQLTDGVIWRLVGHKNVAYCIIDDSNSVSVKGIDLNDVMAADKALGRMPEFAMEYELVAPITMAIDPKFWTGYGTLVRNPVYSPDGTAVVANMIVRNRRTGNYELYGRSWIGVCNYFGPDNAARRGLGFFINSCAMDSAFRADMLAARFR